ncbi:MAG: C40 family peptidase [Spirosomataceae bacterium]
MRIITVIGAILFLVFLSGCSKRIRQNTSNKQKKEFIAAGMTFMGTPYKYGGLTKEGIDCSGLLYNSFQAIQRDFPRVAAKQAEVFPKISVEKCQEGDLVFFRATQKKINHSGIIVDKKSSDEIYFLHASTSKGVRIDLLQQPYWWKRLAWVTRPTF